MLLGSGWGKSSQGQLPCEQLLSPEGHESESGRSLCLPFPSSSHLLPGVSSKWPLTTCDLLLPKVSVPTAAQRRVCYKLALVLVMTIWELPTASQSALVTVARGTWNSPSTLPRDARLTFSQQTALARASFHRTNIRTRLSFPWEAPHRATGFQQVRPSLECSRGTLIQGGPKNGTADQGMVSG